MSSTPAASANGRTARRNIALQHAAATTATATQADTRFAVAGRLLGHPVQAHQAQADQRPGRQRHQHAAAGRVTGVGSEGFRRLPADQTTAPPATAMPT